jgi:hypothetical protein
VVGSRILEGNVRIRTTARLGLVPVAAALVLATTGGAATTELTSVPSAQPRVAGVSSANLLSPELREYAVAQGNILVENPQGPVNRYGYLDDGPLLPAPGDVQTSTHNVEASKTEPDKNTYLAIGSQHGADTGYDYGTHFLFQGHEAGGVGSITRINLDADGAHRVTVMATQLADGSPMPDIDGSTWNPFTRTLLFSIEESDGGLLEATLAYPSTVTRLDGITGNEAAEGIQIDSAGNVWFVEDSGGVNGTTYPHSRQPNSFVYRLVPYDKTDLGAGGKLQVLQVVSHETGDPIVFHAGQADADISSADVRDLHTYGLSFQTRWVTIHDTATDGTAAFDANAAAKADGGTPFKRPENGSFRPAVGFREFVFTETGDTNLSTEIGALGGGFGALFDLRQDDPRADNGTLRLLYRGDPAHTGLDNIAFLTRNQVLAVEDAGAGVHTARNALDSGYAFDVRATGPQTPVRFLAEGRDDAATIDAALAAGGNGFQNEDDNEITGIHVSDGNPTVSGLLGKDKPTPFKHGWRVFWTQQHGDNATWEILRAP